MAHEVHLGDELDVDWTLNWDWSEEMRLREKRNRLIKAQLQELQDERCWSLFPRVHSNDLRFYHP